MPRGGWNRYAKVLRFHGSPSRRTSPPTLACSGSNNTAETLDMTAWAKETGVDACLLVNPYYNKPSQSGIIAHATAVADLGLPVLLYNIPGRSGVKMAPQTIATLAEHPSIVGVKEACGSVAQVRARAHTAAPPEPATVASAPPLTGLGCRRGSARQPT